MKYTLAVEHSTFLTSNPQKIRLQFVQHELLSSIGLINLEKKIESKLIIDRMGNLLKEMSGRENQEFSYIYDLYRQQHVFIVFDKSINNTAFKDLTAVSFPGDRTSINFRLTKKAFVLYVNSRYYPLSGSTKITFDDDTIGQGFKGGVFIRRVNDARSHEDCKSIWSMSIPTMHESIQNLVSVINTDLRAYWKVDTFNPFRASCIANELLEDLNTLMCLLRVNHNLNKFEPLRYKDDLVLEALDSALHEALEKKTVINFCNVATYMMGVLLERLVAQDYQHLLKGFLK